MSTQTENKIKCASCGRTLLIGELQACSFTLKCKKCGSVNLIQVHPHITVQKINPALMVQGKVIGVSLPMTKPSVEIIK